MQTPCATYEHPAVVAIVRKDAEPVRELVVEVGGARVRVGHGFDAALLPTVVRAIRGGS